MDLTDAWVKTRQWVGPLIAGVLLFIAGWFSGRAMSPYWSAHPIVFEEISSPDAGSVAALVALQEQGKQLTTPKPTPVASEAPQPAVAGTASTALFVGSKNSDLYHHRECPSATRIKPENQIWFATPAEAEAQGYKPSQCTKDKGI